MGKGDGSLFRAGQRRTEQLLYTHRALLTGLSYIGEQYFSCSFTMVAVLVGEVCPEEDALSQFVREQDD